MTSGLKSSRAIAALVVDASAVDIGGVVVIGRGDPQRRLEAHGLEHAKHLVAHRRRRGGAVLRIERDDEDAVAAARHQIGEPRRDRGIAVAHRPVDQQPRPARRQRGGELLGLRAGDGLERGFVLVLVPDLGVVARLAARADAQDDAVERELPHQALVLDHARIGEELLEIAAHRRGVGAVGGAEIDEEHADLAADGGDGPGRIDRDGTGGCDRRGVVHRPNIGNGGGGCTRRRASFHSRRPRNFRRANKRDGARATLLWN